MPFCLVEWQFPKGSESKKEPFLVHTLQFMEADKKTLNKEFYDLFHSFWGNGNEIHEKYACGKIFLFRGVTQLYLHVVHDLLAMHNIFFLFDAKNKRIFVRAFQQMKKKMIHLVWGIIAMCTEFLDPKQ